MEIEKNCQYAIATIEKRIKQWTKIDTKAQAVATSERANPINGAHCDKH